MLFYKAAAGGDFPAALIVGIIWESNFIAKNTSHETL